MHAKMRTRMQCARENSRLGFSAPVGAGSAPQRGRGCAARETARQGNPDEPLLHHACAGFPANRSSSECVVRCEPRARMNARTVHLSPLSTPCVTILVLHAELFSDSLRQTQTDRTPMRLRAAPLGILFNASRTNESRPPPSRPTARQRLGERPHRPTTPMTDPHAGRSRCFGAASW